MARTLKEDEYNAKKNQILDAAMHLILTKGYDRMTIQDILDGLGISRGALYYYFDSKQAIVEAYSERLRLETEKMLLPLVDDPNLTGLEKLRHFFQLFSTVRRARKAEVTELGRVWYGDGNALVREKINQAILLQRSALLAKIVRQGVQEQSLETESPEQAGEVIYSLFQAMGAAHARLLMDAGRRSDLENLTADLRQVYEVYLLAIERFLSLPDGALGRADRGDIDIWLEDAPAGSEGSSA